MSNNNTNDCPAGAPELCPLPSDYFAPTDSADIEHMAGTDPWRRQMAAEVKALRQHHNALAHGLASNTELTQQVYENTRVIVEAVQNAGEMWDFLQRWGRRLGRLLRFTAKWVGIIAGSAILIHQVYSSPADPPHPLWDHLKSMFNGQQPPHK